MLRLGNRLRLVLSKKNNILLGLIYIYIDFKDLNEACLKDEFPLTIPKLMISINSTCVIFSFMDAFLRYNQIKVDIRDDKLMRFKSLRRILEDD